MLSGSTLMLVADGLTSRHFVATGKALPFVYPRRQTRNPAQDSVEILGGDTGVRELELGPPWHLLGDPESQTHAHESRPQQLSTQKMRDQEFEASAFDGHFRACRCAALGPEGHLRP
jgi:hypothetical protein